MCLNKSYIYNKYTGKYILVKCGHCSACLQEKAIYRTNRIRQEFDSVNKDGLVSLFFTLTYTNDNVPYIRKSALRSLFGSNVEYPAIYRGNSCIDTFEIDGSILRGDNIDKLRPLRNCNDPDKVGVIYYKDLQNFFKRLRIHLVRNYHYEKYFKYFSCSEYGPTTIRPHFHGLVFVPFRDYQLFKRAIAEAWPFDDGDKTLRYCQVARDASSYVASYVNCLSSVPYIFRCTPSLRPKTSFSKGLGLRDERFSFRSFYDAYLRRDVTFLCEVRKQNAVSVERVLFPVYVFNRYVPKFKGFSRLSSDEVFKICLRPIRIIDFSLRLGLSHDDIDVIIRTLNRKALLFEDNGVNRFDFALCYSQIYSIYNSNILEDFYKQQVSPSKIFYAYDNIADFVNSRVSSPSLDASLSSLGDCGDKLILDYNSFPENVEKTSSLSRSFELYSKDRKVRNIVYSQKNNV